MIYKFMRQQILTPKYLKTDIYKIHRYHRNTLVIQAEGKC